MKKLNCHCRAVEAEINISDKLEKPKMQLFNLQEKRINHVYGKK